MARLSHPAALGKVTNAMVRIAYLLLCHGPPARPLALARLLAAGGDAVVVHYDARESAADWRTLQDGLSDLPGVALPPRRHRCGWGEWSLVAATLDLARTAIDAFPDATHFFLISADCMPIKPRIAIARALEPADRDHIEAVDFFTSGWIRTGLQEERLIYRHFVNERRRRRAFYAMLAVQQTLGLRRPLPAGLRIMIGAQWWCLRRQTVLNILTHVAHHPELIRFFRRSWIPDETFFQSLVAHLVPATQRDAESPTFRLFTDYGLPAVFFDDHLGFLCDQPHFFARKIAPQAAGLWNGLADNYAARDEGPPATGTGARSYAFLTHQGRIGRRFGPRAWDRDASIGRGRRLLLIACKAWHVGQAVQDRVTESAGVPGFGYAFDDPGAKLAPMGGLEAGMAKRRRHARAFLRLLFAESESDAAILCIDPARLDLLRDFAADRCETRVLTIRCAFSDAALAEHAVRIGLAGPTTPAAEFARLAPVLRQAIADEARALDEAGVAPVWRMADDADPGANAGALAGFLGIGEDAARQIIDTPGLFD